jgi:hypothetical protein
VGLGTYDLLGSFTILRFISLKMAPSILLTSEDPTNAPLSECVFKRYFHYEMQSLVLIKESNLECHNTITFNGML